MRNGDVVKPHNTLVKELSMNVIKKNIDDLRPYEKNAKKHDDTQIKNVAESIKQFGFVQPIVIDADGVIVIGHCRYEASRRLGLKEVPCVMVDELSDDQVKALRLADNKTNESPWDSELLNEELQTLFGKIDMNDFGFPVQIENLDNEDLIGEEKIATELNEANNYVVLQFGNETDWEEAMLKLGLENVSTGEHSKGIRRIGIGRVIDGKEVLRRIRND